VDLREYLRTIRKRWLLITICTAAGVGAAVLATFLAAPVYESRTQLFVSAQNSEGSASGNYQGGLFAQQRVKSYADIVRSPAVTGDVAKEVGLTPKQLAAKITATVPLDTILINITVSDTDPQRASSIARSVAEAFAVLIPKLETPAGESKAPVKVTVVLPAVAPEAPSSPRPKVNYALGLLVGLAIGAGAALLRETLDTSVKGGADLQTLVGAKPLGAIAEDPEAEARPLIVHHDPQAPRAEAFRQLRTNLQFIDVDSPPRSIVVTSALAGEGKSTTCCNLAITVAQAGGKVILIEGDLRRRRWPTTSGSRGAVGLTNVLTGSVTSRTRCSPGGATCSGSSQRTAPTEPQRDPGLPRDAGAAEAARERVDLVIIDAPPLLPVTDAAVISRHTDGAV
jgi:capsular polysaccharide biosynthesis protein